MTDEIEDDGPKHSTESSAANKFILGTVAYERAKWFTLIFLPAFGAFYAGLALLTGLPYSTQVVGGCALLGVFLGTILGISTKNFRQTGADGSLNAEIQGNSVVLSKVQMPNITPEELAAKKQVVIQVNPKN